MSSTNKVDANTLLLGDVIMLKQEGKVCYGNVKEIVKQTTKKTFLVLESVVYEDGEQAPSTYAIINNEDLYFSNAIKESTEVLDGTEPFSNGIFLVNVQDEEILKRNKLVDEITEELLAKAKSLIDEPITISVADDIKETSEPEKFEATNENDEFKPISIKAK